VLGFWHGHGGCILHSHWSIQTTGHALTSNLQRLLIFSDQNCRSIAVKAEWDAEIMWLYEYGVFMAILCVAL